MTSHGKPNLRFFVLCWDAQPQPRVKEVWNRTWYVCLANLDSIPTVDTMWCKRNDPIGSQLGSRGTSVESGLARRPGALRAALPLAPGESAPRPQCVGHIDGAIFCETTFKPPKNNEYETSQMGKGGANLELGCKPGLAPEGNRKIYV